MYDKICVKTLHNGVMIPALGLGTWQLPDDDKTTEVVKSAVEMGYHLIDTADCYQNHKAIGRATKRWDTSKRTFTKPLQNPNPKAWELVDVKTFKENFHTPHGPTADDRDIFITGKIFTPDFDSDEKMMASYQRFCDEVGRTPDLMLLHWPAPHSEWSTMEKQTDPKNPETRIRCWKFMERLYKEEKVRAIGVSNYMYIHLSALLEDIEKRGGIVPMMNQIEISPYVHIDPMLKDLCDSKGIALTAYSLLGSTDQTSLKNAYLTDLARKKGLSVNIMCLRWALQKGYCVIPRTSNKDHLHDNLLCFDTKLDDETIKEIDSCHSDKRVCPDPHTIV